MEGHIETRRRCYFLSVYDCCDLPVDCSFICEK